MSSRRRRWFGFGVALAAVGCRSASESPRPESRPEPARPSAAAPAFNPFGVRRPGRREVVPVVFGGKTLAAEIRDDFDGRALGYMGRVRIADDEALLFLYGEAAERSFWMKDCRTTIDILYLHDDGRVAALHRAAPPAAPGLPDDEQPRYPSGAPVRIVLEVRGGLAQEAGVDVGSRVVLPPDLADRLAEAER